MVGAHHGDIRGKPQALIVREERETDREQVEKLIREAFNNHYVPGCFEHYLVRLMRSHEDFLPELDLVAEKDGVIVGSIMYTKATLTDESGKVKNILTFGPIAIHPHHQRKGYGKALMERSFERARELGYDTIVILETPRTTSAADSSAARNTTCTWKTGASPRHYWSKSSSRGGSRNERLDLPIQLRHGYRRNGGTALRRYAGSSRKKMATEPGGILHSRKRLLINKIGRRRNCLRPIYPIL